MVILEASAERSITMRRPFLTANWRYLAMLNFAIDPEILRGLVPVETELDFHEGETFVSVVGFLFLDTRVIGLPIPFHRDFEEVNLRFYVRRNRGDECRRGVVFVRELVPRRAIAFVARAFYGEPYLAVPMRHVLEHTEGRLFAEYVPIPVQTALKELGLAEVDWFTQDLVLTEAALVGPRKLRF